MRACEFIFIVPPDAADPNHFEQIADLLPDEAEEKIVNRPRPKYAKIAAVTTKAGGGVNGPKHPSDIRGEHPSMYPAHQYGAK